MAKSEHEIYMKLEKKVYLPAMFRPGDFLSHVATAAALDLLDRLPNNPYSGYQYEKQVGQLAASICFEMMTGVLESRPSDLEEIKRVNKEIDELLEADPIVWEEISWPQQ